jgi:hypothetical protein
MLHLFLFFFVFLSFSRRLLFTTEVKWWISRRVCNATEVEWWAFFYFFFVFATCNIFTALGPDLTGHLVPEYSSNIIQTTNIYIYIANQFNIQNQVKQPEYSKLYIQNVHAKQPEYSSKTTSPKILLAAKIKPKLVQTKAPI